MAHVHGDHLRAPLRLHPPRLDVALPRHARELHHLAAARVPLLLRRSSTIARRLGWGRLHPVRRRGRREEGEAGRDRRGDGAHLGLGFAPQMAAVRTARGREEGRKGSASSRAFLVRRRSTEENGEGRASRRDGSSEFGTIRWFRSSIYYSTMNLTLTAERWPWERSFLLASGLSTKVPNTTTSTGHSLAKI
jgi:hypothetical protein